MKDVMHDVQKGLWENRLKKLIQAFGLDIYPSEVEVGVEFQLKENQTI